jgi:hypothetical protein
MRGQTGVNPSFVTYCWYQTEGWAPTKHLVEIKQIFGWNTGGVILGQPNVVNQIFG